MSATAVSLVLPALVLAACAPCLHAAQRSAKSPWTVAGHIAPEQFVIQSHRGAGELAPENTLEAFELGWSLGTIPEADLRTTSDGVIVAFHDADFARVVRDLPPQLRDKGVKDVTWEQLAQLDVGAWKGDEFVGRRVSRIADVFALLPEHPQRRLYLDIKNVQLPQLAREVMEHGVERQVILASTKYDIIREWKRLVPQSQTLHWMGGSEEQLSRRLDELRKNGFADITQLQLHIHRKNDEPIGRDSIDPFTLSDAFIIETGKELRSHGILFQTLPYGGMTKEVYWKLLDLGVMSFATAHPKVTLEAVREYTDR
jgi:glycerophosphoryl diester phosphodiesterase